jgi:hypothetical protein
LKALIIEVKFPPTVAELLVISFAGRVVTSGSDRVVIDLSSP